MFFLYFDAPMLPRSPELARFASVLHHVRKSHPTMTIGTLSTLLEIARKYPIDGGSLKVSEVSRKLDIPYPTLMRQTDLLGKGVGKNAGLGLIQKDFSPDNRRERLIKFTSKGVDFLNMLDALLMPPTEPAEPA